MNYIHPWDSRFGQEGEARYFETLEVSQCVVCRWSEGGARSWFFFFFFFLVLIYFGNEIVGAYCGIWGPF